MSCTISPVTSTSLDELKQIRDSLGGVHSGLNLRTTVSANMRRDIALQAQAVYRSTKLTLPLILTDTAEKLEVSGNTMLYTLKPAQTFKLTKHLPLKYVSILNTLDKVIMYSTEQIEESKKVLYAVVVAVNAISFNTPISTDPSRPSNIPLCPQDADFNKSVAPAGVSIMAGVASAEQKTVSFTFFKSTDGGEFSSHPVTKYGWAIPDGTDADKLLLVGMPDPLNNTSYPVDETQPYGYFFKKCRPPGYKEDWARVATKEYSLIMMEQEAPRAVEICATAKGIPNVEPLQDALVNGSLITLRYESGGQLYMPINLFDIRPQQGSKTDRTNIVDPGPFPRKTPRGKKITTGYREKGSTYYSAAGNYQYVQSTWETYAKRYASMFGVTKGLVWLHEAPPQAQVWYQLAYMTENFHKNTAAVRDVFPPFYYAIMVHANNIGNSMSFKFLRAATTAIQTDRAANPGYNVTAAHITCKRVYEQKSWLIGIHNDYMNRALEVLKRELPLINPALYPNNPALYPKSK